MQIVSAEEKAAMERKREEMYKAQIDVQDRIRKAAALGDLSENAEYHFAKEENRSIQKELNDLENKLRNLSVVSNEHVPENMVFLGHTVSTLMTTASSWCGSSAKPSPRPPTAT
jgi:transcription elongation factor GreA